MEIGTQHKYGFNILLDFKPAESPMRPETAEIMRQRAASLDADTCGTVYGFPLADLLAKPIKIIQSPRVSASEALRVIERFHDLAGGCRPLRNVLQPKREGRRPHAERVSGRRR